MYRSAKGAGSTPAPCPANTAVRKVLDRQRKGHALNPDLPRPGLQTTLPSQLDLHRGSWASRGAPRRRRDAQGVDRPKADESPTHHKLPNEIPALRVIGSLVTPSGADAVTAALSKAPLVILSCRTYRRDQSNRASQRVSMNRRPRSVHTLPGTESRRRRSAVPAHYARDHAVAP
jgi:hypothetical protein